MKVVYALVFVLLAVLAPASAWSQTASIAIGSASFDRNAPVEVTSDTLSIDQSTGQAVFEGNVLVVQGAVRMSAAKVTVVYATDETGAASGIAELTATGGVTFVTATEAIEAKKAKYSVENANVVLSGEVLLSQGTSAIAGDRLTVDLSAGTGQMEGRVRTVFNPSGGN